MKIFCQIFIVNISVSEPSIEKILKFFCRNWITHQFKTITLFFGAEFDDFRKIKTPPKRSVWGLFKLISLIFFLMLRVCLTKVELYSFASEIVYLFQHKKRHVIICFIFFAEIFSRRLKYATRISDIFYPMVWGTKHHKP